MECSLSVQRIFNGIKCGECRLMLKNRTLEEKIITRINKSKSNAFILSDFRDLSDKNQVSRVLRKLVKNEFLFKLGQGIYKNKSIADWK